MRPRVAAEMAAHGYAEKEIRETQAIVLRNREILIEGYAPGEILKDMK